MFFSQSNRKNCPGKNGFFFSLLILRYALESVELAIPIESPVTFLEFTEANSYRLFQDVLK